MTIQVSGAAGFGDENIMRYPIARALRDESSDTSCDRRRCLIEWRLRSNHTVSGGGQDVKENKVARLGGGHRSGRNARDISVTCPPQPASWRFFKLESCTLVLALPSY